MKIIFSPSKKMEYKNIDLNFETKEAIFSEKSEILLERIKKMTIDELGKLMKISGEILENTYFNYGNYDTSKSYPAILFYSGISFSNIHVEKYDHSTLEYLENHLRILSAFYGVLTPFTEIKEYRLDMTMKIQENLYSFWKEKLDESFSKDEVIINLASGEFSKLLDRKKYTFIDFEFRQIYGDEVKNVSTEAKKARGKMVDYIVTNKISDIEKFKDFDYDGYLFNEELSSKNKLFFVKSMWSVIKSYIFYD